MSTERIEVYADALFAVARAEGNLSEVEDELFRFARVLQGSDELRDKLTDPHIPAAVRVQIVEDLLGGKAQPSTIGLVSMVVGNGRARELPSIVDRMVSKSAAAADKEVAEVRTAVPLSPDQIARLAQALGKSTGKQVEVKVIIDPTIKGGVIAQIGDTVIDGSVRRRLEQLRNAL
jgi:F-type H+-transporting ATPase subunit delta